MLKGTLALAATVALAAVITGPLMEPNMKARLLHLRLHSYYSKHAPSQLDKVDSLVEKYAADEAPLLQKLQDKYSTPVPEVDLRQLNDPVGVGAYLAFMEAKGLALRLADRLEAQFPRAREAVDAKLAAFGEQALALQSFASAPAQLILLALVYVLLASRLRGFSRCAALGLVGAAVALVVRPGVDDLSPAALRGGLEELARAAGAEWGALALPSRVAAATVAALSAMLTCGRHHKSFVLFAWALAVLAITNPPMPPGGTVLEAVKQLHVVAPDSAPLFEQIDERLFSLHDLTFCSVLTLSPLAPVGSSAPQWGSPVLSVGLGSRWFVLSRVDASKTDETRVQINLPGMALPVVAAPLAFGTLLLGAALISGLA